ncbi:hypothetical protein AAVH_23011 [Aphelenchoides avenae]|nr:hypothetical protein AAVH_23011 [Aphelenchus avenae]
MSGHSMFYCPRMLKDRQQISTSGRNQETFKATESSSRMPATTSRSVANNKQRTDDDGWFAESRVCLTHPASGTSFPGSSVVLPLSASELRRNKIELGMDKANQSGREADEGDGSLNAEINVNARLEHQVAGQELEIEYWRKKLKRQEEDSKKELERQAEDYEKALDRQKQDFETERTRMEEDYERSLRIFAVNDVPV